MSIERFTLTEINGYTVWKLGKFRIGYYTVTFASVKFRYAYSAWRVR